MGQLKFELEKKEWKICVLNELIEKQKEVEREMKIEKEKEVEKVDVCLRVVEEYKMKLFWMGNAIGVLVTVVAMLLFGRFV